MSHPLDHALVVSDLKSKLNVEVDGRYSLTNGSAMNHGGYATLFLSLDPRFQPKQIVLIYDHEDQQFARTLETLFTSRGISVLHWTVDLSHIEETSHELYQHVRGYGKPLPLCVNGDHPLLNTLCMQVFSDFKCPILCCVGGELYRLGARPQRISLQPQIEVDELLGHLGARVHSSWEGIWFEDHLRALSHYLIGVAQGSTIPLEIVQKLAQQARGNELQSPQVKGSEISTPFFAEVLDRFEAAGCVELNQGHLLFSSEKHRAFCGGGWLSLYAQDVLRQLGASFKLWSAQQDVHIELPQPYQLDAIIPLVALLNTELLFFFCVNSVDPHLEIKLTQAEILQAKFSARIIFLSTDTLDDTSRERIFRQAIFLAEGERLKALPSWLSKAFT